LDYALTSDEPVLGRRAQARDLSILVADDTPVNLTVAQKILSRHGHRVTTCIDGLEALALAKGEIFDVILLDHNMPGLDGPACCREMRRYGHGLENVPILALTAALTQSQRKACLDAGLDAVVSKPVDPNELLTAIDQALERHGRLSAHEPVGADQQGR
jgi:CheY-like chemotaxis protein